MKIFSAVITIALVAAPAQAADLPTLPQAQMDITMPAVTGNTYVVAACGQLQSQIDAAAAADITKTHVVVVNAGLTCVGPIHLRSRAGATGWVLIQSSALASLPPPGTRVGTGDIINMPQVKYGSDNIAYDGAFSADSGAQRYRFIGIEMAQDSTINPNWDLMVLGYHNQNALNTGYFIVDRCVIHDADAAHDTYRGVWASAELGHTAVVDSYIAGIKGVGRESQAIETFSSPGPILIQNNFLEAAGENVMFCGALPASQSVQPQDITILRNNFTINPAWQQNQGGFVVKTELEFKCGLRSLVEGNTFEQMSWDGGGNAFRLTARAESLSAGWMEVSDLTIRYNLVRNVTNWINSFASDDGGNGPGYRTMRSKRWSLHDNLVYNLQFMCGGGATCGAPFSAQDGGATNGCTDPNPYCQFSDISFFHNTIDNIGSWMMSFTQPNNQNFDFRDNLANVNNAYGFVNFSSTVLGINGLNFTWGSTWNWANNGIAAIGNGDVSSSYPQGNGNSYPASAAAFLWNNPSAGDYSLQAGSPAKGAASDGTDQGVDFVAFNAARSGSSSPPAQVDLTMPAVTGSTLIATCSTLQAQLNAAVALNVNLTHQIIIATGATCHGPYLLPSHTGGTGWILITGPNLSSLPASGTRVGLSNVALMPQIQYGTDGGANNGAFVAQTGAQRYRFIGIEIVQDSTDSQNWQLISTGYNNQNATNTGYFIFDRVVIHDTDGAHNSYRGIYGDAQLGNVAVVDSYLAGIKGVNRESQAFLAISNPGPILIQNNFLEAAGENMMLCGAPPAAANVEPFDITVVRNDFQVNQAWWNVGGGFQVKNLFELKCGSRVLVEGNTFENASWDGEGYVFRITPRNNAGSGTGDSIGTLNEVSDITVRYNLVRNVPNWILAVGSDDSSGGSGEITKHSKRWWIHDNIAIIGSNCLDTCGEPFRLSIGGDASTCTDPTPHCDVEDLSITHNTITGVGTDIFCVMGDYQVNFDFRNNLINGAGYGVYNCNVGEGYGVNRLNLAWPGPTWSMTYNLMVLTPYGNAANLLPTATNNYSLGSSAGILWNNPAAGDYTLQAGSPAKGAASDGTDQGVDFVAFTAARSGSSSPPNALLPAKPSGLALR